MAKPSNLVAHSDEGWGAQSTASFMKVPRGIGGGHLYSSPAWYAFETGALFHRKGYTQPKRVSMGRGYNVNVETVAARFVVRFPDDNPDNAIVERKD